MREPIYLRMTHSDAILGWHRMPTSCRVFLDKISHAAHALAYGVIGCSVAEPNVLTLALDTLPKMNICQHRNARLVEQSLAEIFRVTTTRQLTRLGDIGPRIERTTRTLAMHTRHLVEQTNDEFASLMKDIAHAICIILRTSERLYCCPLGNL